MRKISLNSDHFEGLPAKRRSFRGGRKRDLLSCFNENFKFFFQNIFLGIEFYSE